MQWDVTNIYVRKHAKNTTNEFICLAMLFRTYEEYSKICLLLM